MIAKYSFIFVISLVFNAGCNKSAPTTSLSDEPKDSSNVIPFNFDGCLIPTAVGNYWIYTDSAQTTFDTIKIIGKDSSDNFLWWKLNKKSFAMGYFSDEFAVRNDSIFIRDQAEFGKFIRISLILPRDYIDTYGYFEGGDAGVVVHVTVYNNSITTPAGIFQQHACYKQNLGLEHDYDSLEIVPNVGVVCRVSEWTEFYAAGAEHQTFSRYLKSYHFENP